MPERPSGIPTPPPPEGFNAPPPGTPGPPPQQRPTPAPNPGYGTPPPTYGGPALQEPAKRRSVWKWILGVVVVFVLGVGGCSVWLFNAVRGPIDAANEFLAAAEAGDLIEVVNLSSSDDACFGPNLSEDLENFLSQVSVTDYNLTSSYVSSNNGKTTGDVSGTIRGGDQTIAFFMVKESDDWLVCGIEIE